MNPKEDGETHINVYSKGSTELGRWLSNFSYAPFVHPEDGTFNSVEGYWYWLSCKHDALRSVHGFKAKQLGRELGGKDWLDDEEFKRKICLALDAKLAAEPYWRDRLAACQLPLKHYYVMNGSHVVEPKQGRWVIEHLATYQPLARERNEQHQPLAEEEKEELD